LSGAKRSYYVTLPVTCKAWFGKTHPPSRAILCNYGFLSFPIIRGTRAKCSWADDPNRNCASVPHQGTSLPGEYLSDTLLRGPEAGLPHVNVPYQDTTFSSCVK